MDYNALLIQLGYNTDEINIAQIKRILNNTDGLNPNDVIALNDRLKPYLCFVAMSSSEDRLKIKNVANGDAKSVVDEMILGWANKHKMGLKSVNETTYYILGFKK